MKCPCRIDGGVSFYVCGFYNCEGRLDFKDAIGVIMDNISDIILEKMYV
jgi:hypothetical protein